MSSDNSFGSQYRNKLASAEDAVAPVQDGNLLIYGLGLTEPPAVLWAFANRLRDGDLKKLRVFSGPPTPTALDSILALDLADCVERCAQFVGAGDRGLVSVGLNSYVPNHFHQLPRLITECMDVDVVATMVSPMDADGFFTFGIADGFISTAAQRAKRVIVEVNEHMPRMHGESRIHIDAVTAVVENTAPLLEAVPAVAGPIDAQIARAVAEMVPDGATFQIGVGAIPAAVCAFLKDHRDLGIHTELLCQGMVDLVRIGVATGEKKTLNPLKHVFTVAAGNRAMLDFMDDNPAFDCRPVSYTNHPAIIARNDHMISVNAAIEMDLLGQANAEFLDGHQFSGSGGQLDFVRGAYDAKGGKSILAFHSTARAGTVSRIVPRLAENAVVTTPRNDTHYVVTEFGVVNLKGKSTRERALALIDLAHPDFRADLLRAAEDMYLV